MAAAATLDLRNCHKAPSAGGMSRAQADAEAERLGIDPRAFSKKDELCREILRISSASTSGGRREFTNAQLAEFFELLSRQEGSYRGAAFSEAANIIANFPKQITSSADLAGVAKIGPGIKRRIDEILLTGKLEELKPETLAQRKAVGELKSLFGVGTKGAVKLAAAGVSSLADLAERAQRGEVKLSRAQELGMKYREDFKKRIPRDEVTVVGNQVIKTAKEINPSNVVEIVGSYRRGSPTSGDVDILMTNPNNVNTLIDLVNKLYRDGLIVATMTPNAVVRFQGVYLSTTGIAHKIDIRFEPYQDWPTALLHATGPALFNIQLRKLAESKGMMLSDHALSKLDATGKPREQIPVSSEADIFRALGIQYIPPDKRDLVSAEWNASGKIEPPISIVSGLPEYPTYLDDLAGIFSSRQ